MDEHQSTLWYSTPFAVLFLVRIFEHAIAEIDKNEIAAFIVEQLLDLFILIAECFRDRDEMEHAQQLSAFSDMLKEEYLWPEEYDEEQDVLRYEEYELFPDDLLDSFWYYLYQALLSCRPMFQKLENTPFGVKAKSCYDR